jgi:predicted ATPase
MLTVIWTEYSQAWHDSKAKSAVDGWIKRYNESGKDLVVHTANETIINEFRIAKKQGKIDKLVFDFGGDEIECQDNGKLPYWPTQFPNIFSIQLMALIKE